MLCTGSGVGLSVSEVLLWQLASIEHTTYDNIECQWNRNPNYADLASLEDHAEPASGAPRFAADPQLSRAAAPPPGSKQTSHVTAWQVPPPARLRVPSSLSISPLDSLSVLSTPSPTGSFAGLTSY
jgi:hypothetical protein